MCAGLEGAGNTSWADLAPSENVAVAYTFIHEEEPLLALKFLARVMASFGGSKGASSALLQLDCCQCRMTCHIVSQTVGPMRLM